MAPLFRWFYLLFNYNDLFYPVLTWISASNVCSPWHYPLFKPFNLYKGVNVAPFTTFSSTPQFQNPCHTLVHVFIINYIINIIIIVSIMTFLGQIFICTYRYVISTRLQSSFSFKYVYSALVTCTSQKAESTPSTFATIQKIGIFF